MLAKGRVEDEEYWTSHSFLGDGLPSDAERIEAERIEAELIEESIADEGVVEGSGGPLPPPSSPLCPAHYQAGQLAGPHAPETCEQELAQELASSADRSWIHGAPSTILAFGHPLPQQALTSALGLV